MWAVASAVGFVVAGAAAIEDTTDLPSWIVPVITGFMTFTLTVLSGKVVVPTWVHNLERARADKWEAEAMRLNQALIDKHVPALDTAVHAVAESSEVVKQAIAVLGKRSR